MMEKAKRIGVAALGLAVAGAAVLLALAFAPTLFGHESLIVTSGSMGRAMPVGSVAVTRLVDARSIAAGDIVSFRYPGGKETITHRVVGVSAENGRQVLETKGDANATTDPEPVVTSGLIHRVERVIPYAGYIIRFLRTPAGAVIVFLVPIIGLTLDGRRKARAPRGDEPPAFARASEAVCPHCGMAPEQYAEPRVAVASGRR